MKLYKTLSKAKILILWLAVMLALSILLIFPTECRAGATNGVFLCLQVLIPSLFPFMLLSDFFVTSGLCAYIPNFIGKAVGCIFGLPSASSAVILLSLVGGYPVGAKGIRSLYDKGLINKCEAQRMAMFCIGAGPGFLVTYLGTVMLGNTALGYILLCSQTISILILGIVSRFLVKCPEKSDNKDIKRKLSIGVSLITSVTNTIKTSALMCALVVVFAILCEVILGFTDETSVVRPLISLLEISTGVKILAHGSSPLVIAFACGFGGICVHLQAFILLGDIRISKIRFCFFRLLQGTLATFFTYILLAIFPQSIEVFSTIQSADPVLYKSITGCVLLVICCAVYLISVRNIRHASR